MACVGSLTLLCRNGIRGPLPRAVLGTGGLLRRVRVGIVGQLRKRGIWRFLPRGMLLGVGVMLCRA